MRKHIITTKQSAIFIAVIIIGIVIVPASIPTKNIINNNIEGFNIFNLRSVVMISWSGNHTAEPIQPETEIREINLSIAYIVTRGMFGKFILKLCKGRQVKIRLEIEEKSKWCTAKLKSDTLTTSVPTDKFNLMSTILSVQLTRDAPAFSYQQIKLKAIAEPLKGPFGLFNIIDGFEQTFNLSFVPGSLIGINVKPESTFIETPPNNITKLPITIENLGNIRTVVFTSIVSSPTDWDVTMWSQVTLDEDDVRTINISITPPAEFNGIKIIEISLTPKRADNPSDVGETHNISILVFYMP